MSETASIQFIGLRTENPLPRRRALAASSPRGGWMRSHRAAGFFGALAVCGRALRAGLSTGMEIVFCVRLGPISMAVFSIRGSAASLSPSRKLTHLRRYRVMGTAHSRLAS